MTIHYGPTPVKERIKTRICPTCGADMDIWREMLHEEHNCKAPALAEKVYHLTETEMVKLLDEALAALVPGECECERTFDISKYIGPEDIRKWLRRRE